MKECDKLWSSTAGVHTMISFSFFILFHVDWVHRSSFVEPCRTLMFWNRLSRRTRACCWTRWTLLELVGFVHMAEWTTLPVCKEQHQFVWFIFVEVLRILVKDIPHEQAGDEGLATSSIQADRLLGVDSIGQRTLHRNDILFFGAFEELLLVISNLVNDSGTRWDMVIVTLRVDH